jgi:hypothetical protein
MSNPNVPPSVSSTGAELRSKDGSALVHLEANKIELSLGGGMTSITVDDVAQEVQVIAANGLWVNGVMVTIP